MTRLVDHEQREVIRTDLDANVVVEAAAGTGKTAELVRRMVAILAAGRTTVERLVAVTFTAKAAGELKLRLRMGLEDARRRCHPRTAEYRRLRGAVAHLEEARVDTIHGFCGDLLRERPVEACVDPEFTVLTEEESRRLFDWTFHRWLQTKLEDPPEGIRRALRRRFSEEAPSELLRRAAWELAGWRDHPAPWRRAAFDREKTIDALVDSLHQVAALTHKCARPRSDRLYQRTAAVRQLSDDIRRFEAVRPRDYDGLEWSLSHLLDGDFRSSWKGTGQYYSKEVCRDTVAAACDELTAKLEQLRSAATADLAAVLQRELLEAVDCYEQAKERYGFLDFFDLLIRARNLLRDCQPVRAFFQNRFTHIFVDEFQDTDPLQAEILLLLSAKDPAESCWEAIEPVPGKLFIVGDPKQSIYRFRRADVGVYLQVKELLARHGARVVQLTTSFRSVPSIQHAINAAFAPAMQADPTALQAPYVPLSPFRKDLVDQPTIIALPVPRPYGKTKVTKTAIQDSLPDAVAAFVQWLLYESGWSVVEGEKDDHRVPVTARHVCLLFRRFESFYAGDVARSYAQALEARGIPHLLVGGRGFHGREEVEMMRAALSAIEWPDDELSVFATLHGSLFAIGDAELLSYRHRYGRLHPFSRPQEEVAVELRPIVSALELLAALHQQRNQRPVADTIARLLEETRSPAGLVLRPSGEQVLANVQRIAELSRAYEQTGGLSFRAFVEQLQADAERGRAPEALILEEGSDGVRLMTTHKAKGLEFPIVILADITAKATGGAARYVDSKRSLAAIRIAGCSPVELLENAEAEHRRDWAEAVRVAYVAATRARDLLVVPAVGDVPFESGWVSFLNGALYPTKTARRKAKKAPACPPFGSDSVFDRGQHSVPDGGCVRPGLHLFGEPDYGVVWWDPKALALGVPRQFGIRQEELLGKKTDPAVIEKDLQRYRDWEASRAEALARGARARLRVTTATRQAQEEGLPQAEVEVIELPAAPDRPGGKRFGVLVHAILATVSLCAKEEEIERVAALQARILGAPWEEQAAAVEAVGGALLHPWMKRAAHAAHRGDCRRETPVTIKLEDGTLVEGVVDLAFRDNGAWVVIDFKTDRELEEAGKLYRRQVGLYADAIRASTGANVQAVLLRL